MREILLWSDEESIAATFPEISELARGCKFSDCGHGDEPGCAVRVALEAGELDEKRFGSYLQLREEVAATQTQIDQASSKREGTRVIRVRREKRRRWKKG
jgi:ribosome biogenesis GTPase